MSGSSGSSAIAELLAKQHGVMVNSGTSAIRLAVDLIGCQPGDEVITPVVTFSSDVAPLVQSGIVPAFVDVEPDTFQIDVDRIEEMITPRTRAILAPDLVGNCPDWDRIREIADRHGLLVIEDSCDVLDSRLAARTGTRRRRRHQLRPHARHHRGRQRRHGRDGRRRLVRHHADASAGGVGVPRRTCTEPEGHRRRFGPLSDGTPYDLIFVFDDVGTTSSRPRSWRQTLVQLEKLDEFNGRRRHNFAMLDDTFGATTRLVRPRTTDGVDTTWMRHLFLLADGSTAPRCRNGWRRRNVATRMVWTGNILRQPGFAGIEHRAPADGFRMPTRDGPRPLAPDAPQSHQRRRRLPRGSRRRRVQRPEPVEPDRGQRPAPARDRNRRARTGVRRRRKTGRRLPSGLVERADARLGVHPS